MRAIKTVLAAGLFILTISPAQADDCMAASPSETGGQTNTPINLDLASEARLDPALLPARASAVMCPHPSIVPRPGDERVLAEWRVAFGIKEPGPRALWISARAGTLQITVEGGELSATERAAVDRWLEAAQLRFVLGWTPRWGAVQGEKQASEIPAFAGMTVRGEVGAAFLPVRAADGEG